MSMKDKKDKTSSLYRVSTSACERALSSLLKTTVALEPHTGGKTKSFPIDRTCCHPYEPRKQKTDSGDLSTLTLVTDTTSLLGETEKPWAWGSPQTSTLYSLTFPFKCVFNKKIIEYKVDFNMIPLFFFRYTERR